MRNVPVAPPQIVARKEQLALAKTELKLAKKEMKTKDSPDSKLQRWKH